MSLCLCLSVCCVLLCVPLHLPQSSPFDRPPPPPLPSLLLKLDALRLHKCPHGVTLRCSKRLFRKWSDLRPVSEATTLKLNPTVPKEGGTDLEQGAGTLNLDVTPAGRIPAADRQVARQVLVSHCLPVDEGHLGLNQRRKLTVNKTGIKFAQNDFLTTATAATDLQPDILGSSGDGGDLKGRLAVLGDQFAGVHVVLRGQLRLDPNLHPISWAPVRVGHLNL